MKLTQLVLADRVNLVFSSRDITLLFDLIEKYMNVPRSILEKLYTLDADFILNRVTISGHYSDIYNLFELLTKLGMEFESITPTALRLDISKFLQTVR